VSEEQQQDPRSERIARNQSLFREVNEQIAQLAERQDRSDLPILCECGRLDCADTVTISAAEYEKARADGRRFVLLPGHDLPEIERVVARTENYVVVEKLGDAEGVARDLDPRAP
jgi:hypothetical protein